MKLKLTAAAVALSALSSLAHAQAQNPQPSFRGDTVEAAGYRPGAPEVLRDFPRPSFIDAAPVEADRVATSTDTRPTAEILAGFPQPSSTAN